VSHGLAEVSMWPVYPALLETVHDQCKMVFRKHACSQWDIYIVSATVSLEEFILSFWLAQIPMQPVL